MPEQTTERYKKVATLKVYLRKMNSHKWTSDEGRRTSDVDGSPCPLIYSTCADLTSRVSSLISSQERQHLYSQAPVRRNLRWSYDRACSADRPPYFSNSLSSRRWIFESSPTTTFNIFLNETKRRVALNGLKETCNLFVLLRQYHAWFYTMRNALSRVLVTSLLPWLRLLYIH